MTNMTIQQLLLTASMLAAALLTPHSRAAERPEVSLMMRPQQDSRLRDGALAGTIQVVYPGAHSGYRVWLEAEKSGPAPERYLLTEKHDRARRVAVRLDGEGWTPDAEAGNGIIRLTQDERVSVDILADGDQQAAAGEYAITVQATIIAI